MEKLPTQLFFEDDGIVPNSHLPVLIYEGAFDFGDNDREVAERTVSDKVKENGWYVDWSYHVYPFLHYHSTAHECLIAFSGKTVVQIGGKAGQKCQIKAGDMLILPAGVGHERILGENEKVESFVAFGVYPVGQKWDFISESKESGEASGKDISDPKVREESIRNIREVSLPERDPVYGNEGLAGIWK